jgi:hypothetical protein
MYCRELSSSQGVRCRWCRYRCQIGDSGSHCSMHKQHKLHLILVRSHACTHLQTIVRQFSTLCLWILCAFEGAKLQTCIMNGECRLLSAAV